MNRSVILLVLSLFALVGCTSGSPPVADVPSTPLAVVATVAAPTASLVPATNTSPPPTATALPPALTSVPPTNTARPATATASATNTALPASPTATPLPPSETPLPPTETAVATLPVVATTNGYCAPPPDNYERVTLARHTINRRTYAMLENAQSLYGGRGSMLLLIQGSYSTNTAASFGTHAGGGVVDIWAVDPADTSLLLNDIPQMMTALRQAGFAAWYRPANSLYQGMFPHIHAVAIGDKELSDEANDQLTGSEGYFRGRAGLPQEEFRSADTGGGPILCDWMVAEGYQLLPYGDTSQTSSPIAGCLRPTNDYERITVDGMTLNRRTYTMLEYAQQLYNGPGNLLWITQGSFSADVAASFGTHAGGGVVDISVRDPSTYNFLYEETNSMVLALRQAGFAAWYRSPDEGFTPHIHAVAIGDAELSEAAVEQLYGANGYFNGGNALLEDQAAPDKHGGPVVCDWMK